MCNFQNLYLENNCFVVRCKNCQSYQIGFSTTVLNCSQQDFYAFSRMVEKRLSLEYHNIDLHARTIVLPTPYYGVSLFLSKQELMHLCKILEEADIEEKAQSMISLFSE